MNAEDFEKQPREPYLFDWWVGREVVPTPLGPFKVELLVGVGETNPPDDEMFRRASELMTFVDGHGEYIVDIVFGYYLLATEDSEWLEFCGVPQGLNRQTVKNFVREDRSLVVSRHLGSAEPYSSTIHLVPLWDEEHALRLGIRNGTIVSANGAKFRLESRVFRWVFD